LPVSPNRAGWFRPLRWRGGPQGLRRLQLWRLQPWRLQFRRLQLRKLRGWPLRRRRSRLRRLWAQLSQVRAPGGSTTMSPVSCPWWVFLAWPSPLLNIVWWACTGPVFLAVGGVLAHAW